MMTKKKAIEIMGEICLVQNINGLLKSEAGTE